MVLIKYDETVMRSAVQTVCDEVNILQVESAILNIQLPLIKDLETVNLTVHFTIYSINAILIQFVVVTKDGSEHVIIESG